MIPALAALLVERIPPADEGSKLAFHLTAPLGVRVVGAFAVCSVGLYYLASGKENADLRKMVIGTVLVFASLFLI